MPSMSTCPEYRSQVEEAVSVSLVQPRRPRNLAVCSIRCKPAPAGQLRSQLNICPERSAFWKTAVG
jgi:hypothetical protein